MVITKNTIEKVYKAKKASVETMKLKGYELIERLFVDSSGWGSPTEPALTSKQFEVKLSELLDEHGKLMAKIIGEGQFQLYIGLFKKTGKNRSIIIGNNTLQIDLGPGAYAIRLHDTNILTFKNGKVTLNSGGWKTRTTKERMNEYLYPLKIQISQKSFEWFLIKNGDWDNPIPFKDGMSVKT